MTDWKWVREDVVLAVHDEQIAEHGGAAGVRDPALLQSALARPQNLAAYGEPDLAALAASYAYGIIRNHPFVDGNKRTGFVVAYIFLLDHGAELTASDSEVVRIIMATASDAISENYFAEWFGQNLRPIEMDRP